MIQDFKFALRQLLKSPGFTGVAVMTLALAIGVNSAIFALINSVVLHPMVPLRPEEVVNVFNCRQNANHDYRQFSYNEYRELRQNGGDLFADLAALEFAVAGIGRDHEVRRSFAFLTSENYFSLMGVKPFRGRFYTAEEAQPNANVPVVVASYGFWKRIGGDNDFVGSALRINGQPYTVIGIAPDGFSGAVALIGTLLMAMAGAVLLIACLNLANMLLARGTARAKEIALRLALGASRWRIVRQLLCEGLLLAVCGGVIGLILSLWCNSLLLHSLATLLNNVNFSFVVDLTPGISVLAVTFLFCLLATVLFSLGPALKVTRTDLVNDLKQQIGEPARIGRFSRFFAPRHISVMAQIALSLMLLFAAGLFFRGALKAAGLNPGFVAAGDLVTELALSLVKQHPADPRRLVFNIVQRTKELPGVKAVGVGTMLPYGNFTNTRRIM